MRAPSIRPVLLLVAGLAVAALTALAACERGPALGPPEGWTETAPGRWVRADADTAGAARDLSTLETMGVRLADAEVVRAGQEDMLLLYRTNPETIDSLFFELAAPILAGSADADDVIEEAKAVIIGGRGQQAQYRQATILPDPAPERAVYPDSLRDAGVAGTVVVQVLVSDEGLPGVVRLVEPVHPTLDALVMRQAATTRYNPAWVVQGRRGGTAIPNYARVSQEFGGE